MNSQFSNLEINLIDDDTSNKNDDLDTRPIF